MSRDIATSGNSLTGQLGEFLFVSALGWDKAPPNQSGFDALNSHSRMQIKARRISEGSENVQLGAIRDLDGFDILAAVLFDHEYKVVAASLIPADVVRANAEYVDYTNSWRLMFSEDLRTHPEVQDVSKLLQAFNY